MDVELPDFDITGVRDDPVNPATDPNVAPEAELRQTGFYPVPVFEVALKPGWRTDVRATMTPAAGRGETNPNLFTEESNRLELTFRPMCQLEWGEGPVEGEYFYEVAAPVVITCTTDVVGLSGAAIETTGTRGVVNLRRITPLRDPARAGQAGPGETVYHADLALGGDEFVTARIASDVGGVQPPAIPQVPNRWLRISFQPTPTLTWLLPLDLPTGGTTSLIEVEVLCTFNVPVRLVALRDFVVSGGISQSFKVLSGAALSAEYSFGIAIGDFEHVSVHMEPRSRIILPPNRASNVLTLLYANAATFRVWGLRNVSDAEEVGVPLSNQATTSLTGIRVQLTFGTKVHNFTFVEDVVSVGAEYAAPVVRLSDTLFETRLRIGDVEHVVLDLPKASGVMYPPNADAPTLSLVYAPAVELQFSHQLRSGDATALTQLTVFAVFNTPVTNVSISDIVVVGAAKANFLCHEGGTLCAVDIFLGNFSTVEVSMAARSGSITPPNAAPSSATLTYIFPLQDRALMTVMKMRFWLDHELYLPETTGRFHMDVALIDELSALLGGVNTTRMRVNNTEPPREGQTAVFVNVQIFPHEFRHLFKSPTALSKEMESYVRRVGRGTLTLQGHYLGALDGQFFLFDQFEKCPFDSYGDWVWIMEEEPKRSEVCPPIIYPCGNGTLWEPCPPYWSEYCSGYVIVGVALGVFFAGATLASWWTYRQCGVVHIATIGLALWTWLKDWVFIGWYLWMGFWAQAQLLLACLVVAFVVNVTLAYFLHHRRWLPRKSRDFDGRYALWREDFPAAYRYVMWGAGIHLNVIRILFSDFMDVDEFGVQPHAGRKKMLAHIRHIGVASTAMQDIPQVLAALWTLDNEFFGGADFILYIHLCTSLADALATMLWVICPHLPRLARAPRQLVRALSSRRFGIVPAPAKVAPDWKRATFVGDRPLGLPLQGGLDPEYPATIKGSPTDQAFEAGLEDGDSLWRINGRPIVPCTFKEAVRLLRVTPRPFDADFRPAAWGTVRRARRAPLPPQAEVGIKSVRDAHRIEQLQAELDAMDVVDSANLPMSSDSD